MSEAPPADAMPIPSRKVDAFVLRAVVKAVREKQSINVLYHSMNDHRPEAIWRRISRTPLDTTVSDGTSAPSATCRKSSRIFCCRGARHRACPKHRPLIPKMTLIGIAILA